MENIISYITKVNLIINEYNKYKIYFGLNISYPIFFLKLIIAYN